MASLYSRLLLKIIRPALVLHEQRQAEESIHDDRAAEEFGEAIKTQVAGNSSAAYREQMRQEQEFDITMRQRAERFGITMERAGEKPLRATED